MNSLKESKNISMQIIKETSNSFKIYSADIIHNITLIRVIFLIVDEYFLSFKTFLLEWVFQVSTNFSRKNYLSLMKNEEILTIKIIVKTIISYFYKKYEKLSEYLLPDFIENLLLFKAKDFICYCELFYYYMDIIKNNKNLENVSITNSFYSNYHTDLKENINIVLNNNVKIFSFKELFKDSSIPNKIKLNNLNSVQQALILEVSEYLE